MSLYLRKERVKRAILNIHDWRTRVQAQASSHLISLLSLLQQNVNSNTWTAYEEESDFGFFDQYFRISGNESFPYFDPLTLTRRISSHPHSNVATARKGTFAKSWHAADFQVGPDSITQWKLAKTYPELVEQRVLTKAGEVNRAEAIDWACWFLRKNEFDDTAGASALVETFRQTFNISNAVFEKLFLFHDEPQDSLFSRDPLTDGDEQDLVNETIFPTTAPSLPAPIVIQQPTTELEDDDSVWQDVLELIEMRTSGIIFAGPPGTGKSWTAQQVALKLTGGDSSRIERVQFHSSLGYEDFVEGYRPSEETPSGFKIVQKTFLNFSEMAAINGQTHVFIIDEINRGDPSRIFGDLLTYMESGWRGTLFRTAFRNELVSIPQNLLILATMNPHDRSVTPLDMALLRRFDQIVIPPSQATAEQLLSTAGFPVEMSAPVLSWFNQLQSILPFGIGHTYFLNIDSLDKLRKVYRCRIEPLCKSVLEYDVPKLKAVHDSFGALELRLNQTGARAPTE